MESQQKVFLYFDLVKLNDEVESDAFNASNVLRPLLQIKGSGGGICDTGSRHIKCYFEIQQCEITKIAQIIEDHRWITSCYRDIILLNGTNFKAQNFRLVEDQTSIPFDPKKWCEFANKTVTCEDPNKCPKCGGKGQVASCGCRCLDCGHIVWG
jgi:hypothetical protein